MSLEDQTIDDYAPRPAPKRRISRGRKALIGLMAIGAFAATQGAGTFASFTASTDNPGGTIGDGDNPFQTPDFELTNTVLDRSFGTNDLDTACVSSDDVDPGGITPGVPASWDLNATDNTSYCAVLFEADPDWATTATADLLLENTGSSDGTLVFYAGNVKLFGTATDMAGAATPCVIDASITTAGHTSLCGQWLLRVQEVAIGGTPLSGTGEPNFVTNTRNDCTFPVGGSTCASQAAFNTLPLFGGATKTIGSLPAAAGAGNGDKRYFRVTATLQADGGCTDTSPADGFNDTTGIGCHNSKQNGSAVILLRWVLQGA